MATSSTHGEKTRRHSIHICVALAYVLSIPMVLHYSLSLLRNKNRNFSCCILFEWFFFGGGAEGGDRIVNVCPNKATYFLSHALMLACVLHFRFESPVCKFSFASTFFTHTEIVSVRI